MKKYKIFDDLALTKSVCLIGHMEPDADALCSMVVLRDFLVRYFNIKAVDLFAECESLPNNYYPILENIKINKPIKNYEVAIMMDTPNIDRLGNYRELFEKAKKKIVIDHHKTNTYSGDINLVEDVSSTCEIVFNISARWGGRSAISLSAATGSPRRCPSWPTASATARAGCARA